MQLSAARRLLWRIRPPVVALGGGGARGFAHIGVLEVLDELRLPVRGIAGTSMGAVIGAMYLTLGSATAVRERWAEARRQGISLTVRNVRPVADAERREHPLIQVARRIRDRVVVSFAVNRATMLDDRELSEAIRFLVPDGRLEDLRLPMVAVATDLLSGDEVRLDAGDLRTVLMASSAIPGLLPSVTIGDRLLVDGGVVAEVPISAAAALGSPVVAVDVSMDLPPLSPGDLVLDTMMRTQSMTARLLREHQLRRCLHVVRPDVGRAAWFDWDRLDELVEAGRVAARMWLGLPSSRPTMPAVTVPVTAREGGGGSVTKTTPCAPADAASGPDPRRDSPIQERRPGAPGPQEPVGGDGRPVAVPKP